MHVSLCTAKPTDLEYSTYSIESIFAEIVGITIFRRLLDCSEIHGGFFQVFLDFNSKLLCLELDTSAMISIPTLSNHLV